MPDKEKFEYSKNNRPEQDRVVDDFLLSNLNDPETTASDESDENPDDRESSSLDALYELQECQKAITKLGITLDKKLNLVQ